MSPLIKICGLTTPDAVEAAREADFNGYIFYPRSPRHVTPEQAARLAAGSKPKSVAVTVDADDALLASIYAALKPAYFQLHGSETPERIREVRAKFGLPVIKAIAISDSEDAARAHAYEDSADMLLFDARPPRSAGLPGGNGLAFDWHILAHRSYAKPWFLSGGLMPDNVEEALRISGASAVDVSSGVESSPGVKDPSLVRAFIHNAKAFER